MFKDFSKKMEGRGYKVAMVITGGGMTAATEPTKYGGASRWFLGAELPYDRGWADRFAEMADEFTDEDLLVPSVSARYSQLIVSALSSLVESEVPTIYVSCSAKLTYEGERGGREHCAFITVLHPAGITTYKAKLLLSSRDIQEQTVASFICKLVLHHTSTEKPYECDALTVVT